MARWPQVFAIILILVASGCTGRPQTSTPAAPTATPTLRAAEPSPAPAEPLASSTPAPSPAAEASPAPAPDAQRVLDVLDTIEKIPSDSLRVTTDVAARAAQLGPDPDKLFTFVRDAVRYEAYEGSLRGARGTLMAMAGNAYDKSTLLAELLRHHGIEVRYLRGRLSDRQARDLVAQMFVEPSGVSSQAPLVADLPAGARDSWRMAKRERITRWVAAIAEIRKAIADKPMSLPSPSFASTDDLRREAEDHIWIEYRRDGRWIALDPTMKGSRPGDAVIRAQETWTEIPDARFHRVRIRVVVEERTVQGVRRRDALRYEASAAVLNGALVTFAHKVTTSLGWSAQPILTIDGRTIAGDAIAESGLAAGVRGLGERLFRTPGSDPQGQRHVPQQEVTGEWLEFDFLYPSGRQETVRREIFDRISPELRAAQREATAPMTPLAPGQEFPELLAGTYVLAFRSGNLSPALAVDRLIELAPRLRMALRRSSASLIGPVLPQALSVLALQAQLQSQFNVAFARPKGVLLYEASPRLTIASAQPTVSKDGKSAAAALALDLRRNDLRVAANDTVPRGQVQWANILRGLMDSAIEHHVIAIASGPPIGPVSAIAIIERARQEGIPMLALRDREAVSGLQISDTIKARMLAGFGDHVVIVTPARPVAFANEERLAWWRLDMASGNSLAVMDTGLHGAAFVLPAFTAAELVITMSVVTIAAIVAIPLYHAIMWYFSDGWIPTPSINTFAPEGCQDCPRDYPAPNGCDWITWRPSFSPSAPTDPATGLPHVYFFLHCGAHFSSR